MTEAQLQSAIIDTARLLGWRVAHFRPAKTAKGYRTAVEADGAGFPDLVLVRAGHLIFAELKSKTGVTSMLQREWLEDLLTVSVGLSRVQIYTWRPADWTAGYVELALRGDAHIREAA